MNTHLALVREFQQTHAFLQAEHGSNITLSDMDIVTRQALLMDKGSATLSAIHAGDMVEILTGLIELAYYALTALAMRGADVQELPVSWRHDGSVLSIMRSLSEKINQCSSGSVEAYSDVYCLCVQLTRSFINADFDKAFRMIHEGNMRQLPAKGKSDTIKLTKAPDLCECLYE